MVKTGFQRPSDSNTSVIVDIGDPYPGRAQLLQYYPNLIPNLKTPGLMSWGYNNYGELGLGDTVNRSSPVQVGSLTNWQTISAGSYFSAAIKTDGTLWTCGYNTHGELGLGDKITRSSPVQVGLLSDWKSVSVGYNHLTAIKTDGTLWTWGYNTHGALGLSDKTDRSSPTKVGVLTNWKSSSGGQYHSSAIKIDGTLWTCGYNFYGQLGLSDTIDRSSPVQVGILTNWKTTATSLQSTVAIATDGTLWSCGYNGRGELGLGDTTNRSILVQELLGKNNWNTISCGGVWNMAIDTDGKLWSWGYNPDGQLGLGDTNNRSIPTQVGLLTNWQSIGCTTGSAITAAIKSDGTLWTWGNNGTGVMGVGDIINRSSPVQVGLLTNWKIVSAGVSVLGIVQGTDF